MSIGGNSIWLQCHIDSQFITGKASGSGKSLKSYPEWSGNTYLERGKKSAVDQFRVRAAELRNESHAAKM